LEEAVQRKRAAAGAAFTRATLREAVIEGALLRLRPKVMTVSTVVAGLLPIMWSTRVGAEVMKPLATPVLGGMVSSLVHVLIVTPVIFLWIHERRLGLREPVPAEETRPASRRRVVALAGAMALAAAVGVAGYAWFRHSATAIPAAGSVVQTVKANDVTIVLLSETGSLHRGRNAFTIEFRGSDGGLLDVGTVRAAGNMAMPGMVMSSGLSVQPTAVAGRYRATAEFGMAGAWQMSVQWDGPAGRGSANFEGGVQ
jgi:Cu(I)/Ag(I) efflux system membrane protein CusA/SilA